MSIDRRNPNVRAQLLRAIIQAVDDTGPQQLLKVAGLAGQVIGEAVRAQHFGLSSNPPAGGEGLMLSMGGGHDRLHAHGFEHPKYRPTGLQPGQSQLYDMGGNYLLLANNMATMFHKASGNYVRLDQHGNIVSHIASTAQQHYLGGDPALGGVFLPVALSDGSSSPYAQARKS